QVIRGQGQPARKRLRIAKTRQPAQKGEQDLLKDVGRRLGAETVASWDRVDEAFVARKEFLPGSLFPGAKSVQELVRGGSLARERARHGPSPSSHRWLRRRADDRHGRRPPTARE